MKPFLHSSKVGDESHLCGYVHTADLQKNSKDENL